MQPLRMTSLARAPNLTVATAAGTSVDASSTRGGAVDNMWPNHTSEISPPNGSDTSRPEWAGLLDVGTGAFAGSKVRQLSALLNAQQALGDSIVPGGAGPNTNHPTNQSYLGFNVPCSPGESFYIESQVRFTVGALNEPAGVHIWFLDQNRKTLASQPAGTGVVLAPGSLPSAWTKVSCSATAPTGACFVHFDVFANSDLGAVTAQFDAIYARRQIDPGVLTTPVITAPTTANFSPSNVKYWKDVTGQVHLQGSATAINTGGTLFILPAGNRPSVSRRVPIWDRGALASVCLLVDNVGTVIVADGTGAVVGHEYFFDDVSFLAEQ